jgi:hypothetical protein
VEFLHLFFIDLGILSATAFKHAGGALKERTFPLMDHRRMHTEPDRQIGGGLLALQGFQRDLRLKFRRMLFAFRHL